MISCFVMANSFLAGWVVVTGLAVVGLAVEPPEGFALELLELLEPVDGFELVPLEWLAPAEFDEPPVLPLVFEPVELLEEAELVAPDTFAGIVVTAGAVLAALAVVETSSTLAAAVTSSATGKVGFAAGSVFKCLTVNAVTPVSAANSTAAATVTAAIVFFDFQLILLKRFCILFIVPTP